MKRKKEILRAFRQSIFLVLPLFATLSLAMDQLSFEKLLRHVNDAFLSERLLIIKTAAPNNSFSSAQVSQLLNSLSFSSDKLEALELLASQIEDPAQSFVILNSLVFDSDREIASTILANKQPKITLSYQPSYARQGIIMVPLTTSEKFDRFLKDLQSKLSSQHRLSFLQSNLQNLDALSAYQLRQVLELFSSRISQVEALDMLAGKLIDIEAAELASILQAFNGSSAQLDGLKLIRHSLKKDQDIEIIVASFSSRSAQEEARLLLRR